ncbi:MAG: Xaa-Pro dipeptidase [Candidatus Heimdallarchaeota archaeon LC_2]|nr:MAG: Xaa-Pro dipeptidase [Candidatus Heimdallarchaeota archaeon LC_2]
MDYPQIFSKEEYEKRINKLETALSDLDISFIFGRADMFYYSSIGQDGFLSIGSENIRYINRNLELARELTKLDVRHMSSFRVFKDIYREVEPKKIGLELDILPYKTVQYIQSSLKNPEIVDISTKLRQIRSIKSEKEQELMKSAAKQTDESFEVAQNIIKVGMSEIELAVEIDKFLRNDGHPGWVQIRKFDHNYTSNAYVMTGESTRQLNGGFGPVSGQGLGRYHMNGPSHRKIKYGDAVLIDTTGVVEGYTADETRTFFVGNIDPKYALAHELCEQILELIPKIMIDGSSANEIYNEVLDLVKLNNLKNNFMGIGADRLKFIGHGVGLELDEFPIITPGYKDNIKAGQIVAIEPKFIFDDPKGGLGIEDTWIVNNNSAEKITKYPWTTRI